AHALQPAPQARPEGGEGRGQDGETEHRAEEGRVVRRLDRRLRARGGQVQAQRRRRRERQREEDRQARRPLARRRGRSGLRLRGRGRSLRDLDLRRLAQFASVFTFVLPEQHVTTTRLSFVMPSSASRRFSWSGGIWPSATFSTFRSPIHLSSRPGIVIQAFLASALTSVALSSMPAAFIAVPAVISAFSPPPFLVFH